MDGTQGRILRGYRSLDSLEGRADRPLPSGVDAPRPKGCRAQALRGLVRGQRGSVSVEGAIAISILVAAFASLMAIVQESYTTDQMARAARAVARAVALDSGADACAAIRRELHLAASFDCNDQWQITIDRGVDPAALSALIAGTEGNTTVSGELVLVRIGWKQTGSASDAASETENTSAGSESTSGDDSESTDPVQTAPVVPMVAMGIARSEPEAS